MIPKKPSDVTWTDEQWEAIYEDNKNIIVSAGAGSGKTAVLTERVIRKLKDGVNINELLILTFTKAAAGEMADRIRKRIKKIPELTSQLKLLDSAYITTFDSFSLSVVKRYHYLLNLSRDISIIDSSVIAIEKNKILEEIFLEYYEKKDTNFLNLIKTFCTKDDTDIKNYILSISNKLDLLSNKKEYLNEYLTKYFNETKIKEDITKYLALIFNKITEIKNIVAEISTFDGTFGEKLEESLISLYNVRTYDELITRLNIKMPNAPRGSAEELKILKSNISDLIKEIKSLTTYESEEEILTSIKSTYPYVEVIIKIILEFDEKVAKYKSINNSYEFNDIAIMAINVVKNNEQVRLELKNTFNEIMIDEYQDTSDLQEEFISMIANDNVYMVGDIKQSIYRFRNANPYIFKNKYDTYSKSTKDKKIDLNKNFRSRSEVLDNINTIFTLIMNDNIGGADYLTSHQMIFGNSAYLKEDSKHSNDMEIYTYEYDKEIGYTKEEIEAFIIANDIKTKITNNYLVFDKDTSKLRIANYSDFSIIIDRATSFDLYKKIFNYFKIPITLLKDEKMNDEDDIHIINNLIRFIIKIKQETYDTEFKYLFTSLMRSYLFEVKDNEIFNYFYENKFKTCELYKKCFTISLNLDNMTIHELYDNILEVFSIYELYLKIGNIHNGIVKLNKLRELITNLENLGYTIYEFSNYLVELLKIGYKMEYKVPDNGGIAVKIMTIHKSKGLEYPVCYFSGLYKEFNISDLKERFLASKDYGIITPYFNNGIATTIYKELLKQDYLKEEISEKIRLFYVALTRAREKMIMLKPTCDKYLDMPNVTVLDDNIKYKYRTLADMLDTINFRINNKVKMIDLNKINLTKDYSIVGKNNWQETLIKSSDKYITEEIVVNNTYKETATFSKKTHKLLDADKYNSIKFGLEVHEYLEYFDFKNPNLELIENEFIKKIIQKLLEQPIMKNIKDANIYQEYEFIYLEEEVEYHGIIDLMLEYDTYINIIDYKLKNINDEAYKKQLLGYKKYIELKTKKPVNLYLYSLLTSELKEIK